MCKISEKAMAPHSTTLAWKIPSTVETGRLQSMGSLRVRHNWATSLSCIGEGNGNPLQCSCLENPRDREPGGLPSMGSHRVSHNWSDLAAAATILYNTKQLFKRIIALYTILCKANRTVSIINLFMILQIYILLMILYYMILENV